MENVKSFFDILGINETTNEQAIKDAYESKISRKLSKKESWVLKIAYQNCLVFVHEQRTEISNSALVAQQVLSAEFDPEKNQN